MFFFILSCFVKSWKELLMTTFLCCLQFKKKNVSNKGHAFIPSQQFNLRTTIIWNDYHSHLHFCKMCLMLLFLTFKCCTWVPTYVSVYIVYISMYIYVYMRELEDAVVGYLEDWSIKLVKTFKQNSARLMFINNTYYSNGLFLLINCYHIVSA